MANGPIYGEGMINLRPQLAAGFAPALSKLLGPLGTKTGAMFAGAFAAGFATLKIGDSFTAAFRDIRVGTGATGQALEGLKDDFRDVFGAVPASAGDAAKAIAELNTRLGLTGKPLQDMSKQFLDLSRLTGGDVSANIASVTRVFGDWAVATADQSGHLDQLFRASQATGISIDQLARNLVQYGAPLRQVGFSFAESAALISKFEREGVNAELVLGSLRIALGKMAREGEPAVETFRRMVTAIETAGDVSEANALALELFGARAGPDMAAAIREGRFAIDELVATISNGTDTIARAAEETRTWQDELAVIGQRLQLALEPVATALSEQMLNVFTGVGEAFGVIASTIDAIPGPAKNAAVAIGGITVALKLATAHPLIAGLAAIVATLSLVGSNARDAKRRAEELGAALEALPSPGDDLLTWQQLGDIFGADTLKQFTDAGVQMWELRDAVTGGADAFDALVAAKSLDERHTGPLIDRNWDLERAIGHVSDALGEHERRQSDSRRAMWDSVRPAEELAERMGLVAQRGQQMGDDVAAGAARLAKATAEHFDDVFGTFNEFQRETEDTVTNVVGVFGTFPEQVKLSLDEVRKLFDEQLEAQMRWQTNLATLHALGLSDIAAEFASAGPAFATALDELLGEPLQETLRGWERDLRDFNPTDAAALAARRLAAEFVQGWGPPVLSQPIIPELFDAEKWGKDAATDLLKGWGTPRPPVHVSQISPGARPMLHSGGLADDEQMAILQRGELVVPSDVTQKLFAHMLDSADSAGGVSIQNLNVHNPERSTVEETVPQTLRKLEYLIR